MREHRLAVLSLVTIILTGCGTIISGTRQQVDLAMNPPGSEVSVYRWTGEVLATGRSPGTIDVHRPEWLQPFLIRASKEGYCPKYWVSAARLSPGGWVSTVFIIGVVPYIVDSYSGGLYSLVPDPLQGTLQSEQACESDSQLRSEENPSSHAIVLAQKNSIVLDITVKQPASADLSVLLTDGTTRADPDHCRTPCSVTIAPNTSHQLVLTAAGYYTANIELDYHTIDVWRRSVGADHAVLVVPMQGNP